SRGVQAIAFGGYTWREPSALSLEAGADYVVVTAAPRYDYPEVYGGFAFQNVNGRLYYSPRYFGRDAAAYAEVNVAHAVLEHVRLLAHAGVLGGPVTKRGNSSGPVLDAAAGVALDWERFILQLSWAGLSRRGGAYAVAGAERRSGFVVSL